MPENRLPAVLMGCRNFSYVSGILAAPQAHPEHLLPATLVSGNLNQNLMVNMRRSVPSIPTGRLTALPNLFRQSLRDLLPRSQQRSSPEKHLLAAINWLKRAQDATDDGGVSSRFSLRPGRLGWWSSYRETTGYIVETFFDVAQQLGDDDARKRAVAMVEWLVQVQNPDGSISNPSYGNEGIVFDTGQVLHGLVRAYRELHQQRFLDAALRAGHWLADTLDDDGAWRRYSHQGHVHTYNTRVAWAMLELDSITSDPKIREAAERNLEWALTQEQSGWFDQCAFHPGMAPFTHTIAYAIRGFLEAAKVLHSDQSRADRYRAVAERSARAVLEHVREDGFIPGQIDIQGKARASYCCLTGNCQLAIIWFQLFQITGDPKFLHAGTRSVEYVMETQAIETLNVNIRGAIKGSHPIWGTFWSSRPRGGYTPLAYPNWATKFFVEALLLQRKLDT